MVSTAILLMLYNKKIMKFGSEYTLYKVGYIEALVKIDLPNSPYFFIDTISHTT